MLPDERNFFNSDYYHILNKNSLSFNEKIKKNKNYN